MYWNSYWICYVYIKSIRKIWQLFSYICDIYGIHHKKKQTIQYQQLDVNYATSIS
jgi:hypothetical protein